MLRAKDNPTNMWMVGGGAVFARKALRSGLSKGVLYFSFI